MIISMFQFKGGSGKTSGVANIGACLAEKGNRVLLVDADPQAHLTTYFNVDNKRTLGEIMLGKIDFFSVNVRKNLDVIPSSLEMVDLELALISEIARECFLKDALAKAKGRYDYILIDCSPYIGILTINTLVAADHLLIPVQPEFFSECGLVKMLTIAEKVKKLNPSLAVLGAFISRFDRRTKLHRHICEDIRANFPHRVFGTVIRENIAIAEAPAHGKTIFEFKRDSNGAADYLALVDEILKIKKGK